MDEKIAVINDGWWPILKVAVSSAAEEDPFGTLVVILFTIIILALVPMCLILLYKLRAKKLDQQHKFDMIRDGKNETL
jgi:heme/copper-type cytochrome/quinol oxidase subunit 2